MRQTIWYDRPNDFHHVTQAEKDLVEYLIPRVKHFCWESIVFSDRIHGFRTFTYGFEIVIRLYCHGRRHSYSYPRWRYYDIDTKYIDHWFYLVVKDTRARHGIKQIVDYAAPEDDPGYWPIRHLYEKIERNNCHCPHDHFTPRKLLWHAKRCLTTSPTRRYA